MKMGEMKCVDLDGTARVGGGGTLVQDVTNLPSHLSATTHWLGRDAHVGVHTQ